MSWECHNKSIPKKTIRISQDTQTRLHMKEAYKILIWKMKDMPIRGFLILLLKEEMPLELSKERLMTMVWIPHYQFTNTLLVH